MKFYHVDRAEPLKVFDDLTQFETTVSQTEFSAVCNTDEHFIFPLVLLTEFASETISVSASLIVDNKTVDCRAVCFNTSGIDKFGKAFEKKLVLKNTEYQPLYVGVDTTGIAGKANILVTIQGESIYAVIVKLTVTEKCAARFGDGQLANLSRLFWLNGNTALDKKSVKNCLPVQISDRCFNFLGRSVTLSNSGLPQSAESRFEQNLTLSALKQADYFRDPISFVAEGETFTYEKLKLEKDGDNAVATATWISERLTAKLTANVKYEGAFYYSIELTAKDDYSGELKLTMPLSEDASVYNNGLGKHGGYFKDIDFKFNSSHQDCLFVGGVNAGVRLKLKAEKYVRPLVNVYYKAQPMEKPKSTWDNNGKGSIRAYKINNRATVDVSTGNYTLKSGETHRFDFELHFTPFQPLDSKKQFGVRYYHSNRFGEIEKEVATAKKHGLNYIVVHHGNEVHPFINYPFVETEKMNRLIELAHREGIKVKFYYTLRESSNHMAELFAYKSFGDEIILRKKFSGYGWMAKGSAFLSKYFGEDIVAAWRVPFRKGKYKGDEDAAFITRPDSRLDNYYIEGLKYLTEELKIDGIYIDDTSLDRTTLERAKKVLDARDGLIDMHMWNHEEERAGNASCMNLYTELFPFIDSVWVGEGFDVRGLEEDFILTEVSGLPYGKPGQMLEGGGDPFVGMLYAMNNRYGWGVYNADKIYRLWDDFQIQDAELRGYWDNKNPFRTTQQNVKVTAYIKQDQILLALYNFGSSAARFAVTSEEQYIAERIKVKGVQRGKKHIDLGDLKLKPRRGIFLLLKKRS